MTTISVNKFQNDFQSIINTNHKKPVLIKENNKEKGVFLSFAMFKSLKETAHLLSNTANRKHLTKSLKDLEENNLISVEI